MKRTLVVTAVAVLALTGCSKLKSVNQLYDKVVSMDIPLEEQQMLNEKYVGRNAWARLEIEDIKEQEVPGEPKKRVIPMDAKVQIIELNYSYNGAVIFLDSKNRKIAFGLGIETPLSVEKIENRLGEIVWFDDPTLRHVSYIRKWGKRAARAVMDHEVFIGMSAEAAMESWGIPSEIRSSEIGDKQEEQWVYKEYKRTRYIYLLDGLVSKYDE